MGRKEDGFMPVGLMIALAVLLIMATVAYPLYTGYTTKARRSDARVAVLQEASAQERFFTLSGRFSSGLLTNAVSRAGFYDLSVVATTTTFTVTVTPRAGEAQVNDAVCSSFSLDQTGVKGAAGTDPHKCW